jgi:hypothetical protein
MDICGLLKSPPKQNNKGKKKLFGQKVAIVLHENSK